MLKSKKGIIKPKLESGNLGSEISRIDTIFTKAGLKEISVPSLLNSSDLVDLYGEDLKLRAYTTSDPVRGEQILRPDFTVPILFTISGIRSYVSIVLQTCLFSCFTTKPLFISLVKHLITSSESNNVVQTIEPIV